MSIVKVNYSMVQKNKSEVLQRKRLGKINRQDNAAFILMCLPAALLLFVFSYIPMFGVVLAFKDFNYAQGIWGSKWVGLKNFVFFFTSQDALRVTVNTIGLNIIFIFTAFICAVVFALMLYEIKQKTFLKVYNTSMVLPNFVSWVVVGYMTYALFEPNAGLINKFIEPLGINPINWYEQPAYWPWILMTVNIWKSVGVSCIIYYSGLMGIDNEYFEAAKVDGATKLQSIWYISIPSLTPLMIILNLLAIGGIFRSDFGMFYNLTRDIGTLYSTTDVIDTYIYRALRSFNEIGISSAVGLYQSAVGFLLVVITNWIVTKIDSDSALF